MTDLDNATFIIEGESDSAIKIYFESEQNRDEYFAMDLHGSGDLSGLKAIFDVMVDNPSNGYIN